jgi:serine protease Do
MTPSEIFEKLSSAVFKIHTSTGYQGFQGSGFFISSNGIAVSNYHVFQGTAVGYEDIILSDGSTYKVTEVYHKSQENDFIIFKVGVGRKVNYVKIANNTPKVGEKIYTIGSPRGLDNTFSSGEISQIRENGKILQISAPIDHGSSGGVLLNSKGEAVGITSGGIDDSGANLNYAWNIQLIKPYIP